MNSGALLERQALRAILHPGDAAVNKAQLMKQILHRPIVPVCVNAQIPTLLKSPVKTEAPRTAMSPAGGSVVPHCVGFPLAAIKALEASYSCRITGRSAVTAVLILISISLRVHHDCPQRSECAAGPARAAVEQQYLHHSYTPCCRRRRHAPECEIREGDFALGSATRCVSSDVGDG